MITQADCQFKSSSIILSKPANKNLDALHYYRMKAIIAFYCLMLIPVFSGLHINEKCIIKLSAKQSLSKR